MSSISALTGLKSGKDLEIEKMTANLRMTRDGLRADNFIAVLPAMGQIVGAGTIDSKNNLDFKMAATLKSGLVANVANPGGALSQVMGGGSSGCKSGVTVPFKIEGTTADPKFVPDVGGVAAGMLKSQLGCAGSTVTGAKDLNPSLIASQQPSADFSRSQSRNKPSRNAVPPWDLRASPVARECSTPATLRR